MGECLRRPGKGTGAGAEQGPQRVVTGDLARDRVPGEPPDIAARQTLGGRPYAHRLPVPDDLGTVLLQDRQSRPQVLGHRRHPVTVRQYVGGVRGRGAQHRQDPEGRGGAHDGDVQRTELERQTRRELRIAAHRLGGVGEQHLHAQPMGVGGRERPAQRHPPPGTEQLSRQSGQHGQPQQFGGAGAQVHTPAKPRAARIASATDPLSRAARLFSAWSSRSALPVIGLPSSAPREGDSTARMRLTGTHPHLDASAVMVAWSCTRPHPAAYGRTRLRPARRYRARARSRSPA